MRQRLGTVVLLTVLTGCGGSTGSDGDVENSHADQAECTPQVRFQGTIYTEIGYSSESVARLGMADEAACADVGRDAKGSYFPDDPQRVEVGKFDSYSSTRVIGVRKGDLLGVYVSEDLDTETASSIAADLR